MLMLVGNGLTYVSLNVSFGLEKTVGGKYGRSIEAAPVFFVSYVQNNYLMNIADACLCWERFD